MLTALLVIAILVLLIVAHELGHFIVAKIARVRVEEFGVGYPPRAFSFGRREGTEYTLNWIPFGGFVRLFGDEGERERGRGSFVDASRPAQAAILVAGVAANAIAAWALFAVSLHIGFPQVVAAASPGEPAMLVVSDIVPGSPADAAGLRPGDRILDVKDEKGKTPAQPLVPASVVDFVRARGGKPVSIFFSHAGATSTAVMIPANAIIPNAAGRVGLGIGLVLVANRSEPWRAAARGGLRETWNAFGVVASNLWSLARGILRGKPDLSGVVGPVGIVSYVEEASQHGIGLVFRLAALISVNLAIINLIPVPALDGGRIAVLLVEGATRRAAPRLVIQMLNAVGVALIIFIMVAVTYHDIARLFA